MVTFDITPERHFRYRTSFGALITSTAPIPDDATGLRVSEADRSITFEVEIDGEWMTLGHVVTIGQQ